MKHLVLLILFATLSSSCEPRDPQVLTPEEMDSESNRQGREGSGSRMGNSNGGSFRGDQISWERNFDTIGSLILVSELNRILNFKFILDHILNQGLDEISCAKVTLVNLDSNRVQGNIQLVNCFFPGETNISLSGTLYFERKILGQDQVEIYQIKTDSQQPLSYKIRGPKKTVDLFYGVQAEWSSQTNNIQTHSYQSEYQWVNGNGQTQNMKITGFIKPSQKVGAKRAFLSYSSQVSSGRGPFFDLTLESIESTSILKESLIPAWCAEDSESYTVRFDYKPSMRRSKDELKVSRGELFIKSSDSSTRGADKNLKFNELCKTKSALSLIYWIINPGLFFIE
jgi:hypothetical protein